MPRVVKVKYEGGVLKPLEELGLKEGEELIVIIRKRSVRYVLDKYTGVLGRAHVEELRRYEEEAQAQ